VKSLKRIALSEPVSFDVKSGTTYHIQVLGMPTTPFNLHLEFTPRPANDDFAGRFQLEGVSIQTNGGAG